MVRIHTLGIGAALLVGSSVLYADWGSTHWGDSVEQVIAAAGGNAKLDRGNRDQRVFDQDRLASSTGELNGIAVRTEYFFDAKSGLSLVQASPQDVGGCKRFVESFMRLGKPDSQDVKPMPPFVLKTWEWADAANNLKTQLVLIEGVKVSFAPCHVTYSPAAAVKPPAGN